MECGLQDSVATFDEGVKVVMFDGSLLQSDLEGEQQCEQELVLLIEPTAGVAEYTKSEVVNDIVDTFAGDGGLVRPDGKYTTHTTTHQYMNIMHFGNGKTV